MRQEMSGFGKLWHQLDHMQTICTSLQADNHTNTLSLNLYMPNALSDVQPKVLKHRRTILTNQSYINAFQLGNLQACCSSSQQEF